MWWLGAEQALRGVYEIAASKEEDFDQFSFPFKKYYTFYKSSPILGFGWFFSNKLPVVLWRLDKLDPGVWTRYYTLMFAYMLTASERDSRQQYISSNGHWKSGDPNKTWLEFSDCPD